MLFTREYSCPGCGKRIKLISGSTRYINTCTSQIIQQGLLICMQPEEDMPMLRKDDNASVYFEPHKSEEYTLNEQDIERDHRDSMGKSSNTRSFARDNLSGRICQDGLLASKSSLFLREVRFSE